MKKIFVIDWALLIVFAITAISGFKLHIVGHFSSHEEWHNWAVFHNFASLAFIIFGVLHIQTHWGWYKSLVSKGLGKKSRITVWLTLIYFIAIFSGLLLLFVAGANTEMGLWHYRIGIILTIISAGHIFKRLSLLRKSIQK